MLNKNQIFGKDSESFAVKYLKKMGYKILEQNFRTKLGEIDIIAKDKKDIVFIEVKSRKSKSYGNPKLAVTKKKQRSISMAALWYLKSKKQSHAKARFDVAAVTLIDNKHEIEIVKNAFELAFR